MSNAPKALLPATALLLCLTVPPRTFAQESGRLGVMVDAQLIPQAGLFYSPVERVSLRLTGYAEGGGEYALDIWDTFILSLSGQYYWPGDNGLSRYLGVDVTRSDFEDETYVGGLAGVLWKAHERVSLYGELGVSLGVSQGIGSTHMSMFNTGVGLVYFLW